MEFVNFSYLDFPKAQTPLPKSLWDVVFANVLIHNEKVIGIILLALSSF